MSAHSKMNLQPRAKIWIIAPMQKPDLDFVIAALKKIRETSDRPPRASRSALTQLQLRAAVAASLPAAPKLREGGREALERHAPPVMPKPMAKAGSSPKNYLGADSAAPSKEDKSALLVPIRERVRVCTKCPHLVSSRTQTVFGVGNPNAELMFVGEAPGFDEDRQGEPFVGRAGQLLTRIIKAMGFAREDVYIANVLKCRPDMPKGAYGNRTPTPQEMQTCRPYLVEQIDIIQPKVVVALGAVAVEGLLGTRGTMRELRGRWHSYNGVPLMITYHPAYLLRNQAPSEKRKVWEDMLQVLERLEKPISDKQRNYFKE